MSTLSLNAKEAIKIGLAMVLVYGIALQLDWMNPSWAGFTVAFISLATVGESLHKGVQRLAGTIPGCIMALAILGLVPQDRWLFIVYLFTVGCTLLVFAMSYMIRSSRPEKAVLQLLRRFFRSSEFLLLHTVRRPERRPTILVRWRTAYHRHEVSSLPRKIGTWSKFINHEFFPGNTPDQVQALQTTLQTLVNRIEILLDTRGVAQADRLLRELHDDMQAWRVRLGQAFKRCSADPGAVSTEHLRHNLDKMLAHLEDRFTKVLNWVPEGELSAVDYGHTYRLLGSYRGVSEAAIAYTAVAGDIDFGRSGAKSASRERADKLIQRTGEPHCIMSQVNLPSAGSICPRCSLSAYWG